MFAIFGATGKVGYATAAALRQAGMQVRAIVRNESKAGPLREIGCEIVIANLYDPESLTEAFRNADVVQIILPPTMDAADPAEKLREGINNLANALEKTRPRRLLAISDYGAHVENDIGMPTICRGLEERLARIGGHKIFLRSAEHMQGWERVIPAVKESGKLPTFHSSVDKPFPTISAPDLGPIATRLLLRPLDRSGVDVVHAEGPKRYCAADVANELGGHLGRIIETSVIPREQWKEVFEQAMKPSLAELLIKANDAQNQGGLVDIEPNSDEVYFGTTTLFDALGQSLKLL
ncbi:2-succinyl-5-enolpyruvyl-6-hydroxy-3-cyclohexene-1- carboxylate synthase [Fusarium austroafricanum]|uniref:2-succinyl-5-enolpyruvyl-6-hydroxy-3-cyclohexene-1-carboxylate synthase n=1 Tax=Fusarium austroafricanum TaxID=2364996 RepID=A0A8H4KJZ2_9HYPO|nr:2-succinyl-5-enolpyruvyl-6-hydroxy-3-cyclohexene-1- carboxylate synthase [Fusarium austroafricanum]